MVLPGDFRQIDLDGHDTRERALDFHVKAGKNGNPTLVIAILVGIPRIPATAQVIAAGFGLELDLVSDLVSDLVWVCAAADDRQARAIARNRETAPYRRP